MKKINLTPSKILYILVGTCVSFSLFATQSDQLRGPSVNVTQKDIRVESNTSRVSLIATGKATEGKITAYHWKQTSGPQVKLSDIYTDWASFNAPDSKNPTHLTFEVTVFDSQNQSAKSTVQVTVVPKSSTANVANAQ